MAANRSNRTKKSIKNRSKVKRATAKRNKRRYRKSAGNKQFPRQQI